MGVSLSLLMVATFSSVTIQNVARAMEPVKPEAAVENRTQALIPDIEAYIANGMSAYDVPGLAIGIVAGDKLVYAKGFGLRSRGGKPVDTRTIFQIGSATKAFLAATMAIIRKLRWDDRIVDLDPDFQLSDPWVTREFRVFDLLAQRSGLPPYVNDTLAILGIDEAALIRSLRHVEPVSSFRTTFAYTNITHLLAGRIVAKAADAADWNAVLRQELLDPLGMKDSSYTAEAIKAATNRAEGHRWTPNGTIEVPFTQVFPYDCGGAGDINSTVEDMAHWIRLQLGNGAFEGRQMVSPENLRFTHQAKVAISDKMLYALGWIIQQTPNGNIIWHNGGTLSFGAFVGMAPDKNLGVVVLTNEQQVGFPDAIGLWILDRILENSNVDYVADTLKAAKSKFETATKLFDKPGNPRPSPPIATLAGNFVSPSVGGVALTLQGGAMVMEILASGAKLELAPWDGDVFTVKLMPLGKFVALAEDIGPVPIGFVQFQIDKEGKLNLLHLSVQDDQTYLFRRR
jgi:CubicO group peptidase (beta-lactamase class C family)